MDHDFYFCQLSIKMAGRAGSGISERGVFPNNANIFHPAAGQT